MDKHDDDLRIFEREGAPALPDATNFGFVKNEGASIWYAAFGSGDPVILLHGGLGHSGNWGYQVPMLVEDGHRAIVIDSRGHGRSTRDDRPFTYEQMARDVLSVMDALQIAQAALVGWSDGAVIALTIAAQAPQRTTGVFFFACNTDPSGVKEIETFPPALNRCFSRHQQDYQQLSATPDAFEAFTQAVGHMQRTQPNYTQADLAKIGVPVAVVQSEYDEFIKQEHAEYLAESIPRAWLVSLPGVSHFAPLQRPDLFNQELRAFLEKISAA